MIILTLFCFLRYISILHTLALYMHGYSAYVHTRVWQSILPREQRWYWSFDQLQVTVSLLFCVRSAFTRFVFILIAHVTDGSSHEDSPVSLRGLGDWQLRSQAHPLNFETLFHHSDQLLTRTTQLRFVGLGT